MNEVKLYTNGEILRVKTLTGNKLQIFKNLSFKIFDCKEEKNKHGKYNRYFIKIKNNANNIYIRYFDSIINYKNNYIDLNNLLHCLISDYNIVNNTINSDIEEIIDVLINEFDYKYNNKENRFLLNRTANDLLDNYDNFNKIFKIEDIEFLTQYLEEIEY